MYSLLFTERVTDYWWCPDIGGLYSTLTKQTECTIFACGILLYQMNSLFFRYDRGRVPVSSPVISWLWQVLESFSTEERILFLRFVSGRSRLPVRVSEINQRFQISVQRQVHTIIT